LAGSCGKEEEGRRPGATGIAAARGPGEVESGKEKGRRRGGTDRRGRRVSGEEKIEREGTGVGRCGEGEVGCWAARPKGKEVFFPFSFPNLFQFKLFLSNSNQNSSNLFTKFYELFKSLKQPKTMQSLIMMHKHLLSLN
jgi:hypothetical protein